MYIYLELLCQSFALKLLTAYFPDHMVVGILIDIGQRFNSALPHTLASELKVKVMDLEFLC